MQKLNSLEEKLNHISNVLDRNHIKYERGECNFYTLYSSKYVFVMVVSDSAVYCWNLAHINANVDDSEEMDRLYEFISRTNSGMLYGYFILNGKDLIYHYGINVDLMELSDQMIEDLINVPILMQNQYLPGIEQILSNNMNPKEAVEWCEN